MGHALVGDHDWDVDVLDLVFDSVVDDSVGLVDDVRSLKFVRGDRLVEVDVRGHVYLNVGIKVRPDDGATVTVLAKDHCGHGTMSWQCGRELSWLPSGLTSFLFEWPAGERSPARTAWVLL